MMAGLASVLLNSSVIPWRLRNRAERWLETSARAGRPGVYRLLRFGQFRDPVRAVTSGPHHHFFGYYDKSPWSASGDMLLAHEASFNDRPPAAGDRVRLGRVRLDRGMRFEAFADSAAWNWQQGAMLQWLPGDADRRVIYNDVRRGCAVGVVRDLHADEERVFDRPIYAVGPDGRWGYSVNFARLHRHRPGYGYAGADDPWADEQHPSADGLFRIALDTGESELLISLDQLARLDPLPSMDCHHHWLNHVQVSPSGRRVAFFHIWRTEGEAWAVRLYALEPGTGKLFRVLDSGRISHYDWEDDEHILVWARRPNVGDPYPGGAAAFLLCSLDGSFDVVGTGVLTEDGHCSYSPNRRWVLNDTYPDRYDMRTLMLFRPGDGRRIDLARLHSPKARWWGEMRCDLHPRWSRDGRQVCIDSVHTGTRQMYVVDVARWLR